MRMLFVVAAAVGLSGLVGACQTPRRTGVAFVRIDGKPIKGDPHLFAQAKKDWVACSDEMKKKMGGVLIFRDIDGRLTVGDRAKDREHVGSFVICMGKRGYILAPHEAIDARDEAIAAKRSAATASR